MTEGLPDGKRDMLPKSWHVMSASVANRLARACLCARDKGNFEVSALLYTRGRRIEGYSVLTNLSKEPGRWLGDPEEYSEAIDKLPQWATSAIFFHSHPSGATPSCRDVRLTSSLAPNMIFDCVTRTFFLYRYPRIVRKEAREREDWRDIGRIVEMCRAPLYVETGVKCFDSSVMEGRKHSGLVATLRKRVYGYLRDTVSLFAPRGLEVIGPAEYRTREDILARLLDGLEYYVQFPKHEKPKKRLKDLEFYEEDFLVASYELFYVLSTAFSVFEEAGGAD